jgi:hypothetical protein
VNLAVQHRNIAKPGQVRTKETRTDRAVIERLKTVPDRRLGVMLRRPAYKRSQTEMCFALSSVNGDRSQSAHRWRNVIPAI